MDNLVRLALRDCRFADANRELRNARISMRDVGLTVQQQEKVATLAALFGNCGHIPGTMGDFVDAIVESLGVPPRPSTED